MYRAGTVGWQRGEGGNPGGMSVLVMLKCETCNNHFPSTRLRAAELQFLLKDLTAKLEHRLVAATARKLGAAGFPGRGANLRSVGYAGLDRLPASELVAVAGGLLRNIFADLDEIFDFFARLIRLQDGMMDGAAMFDEEAALLSDCLCLGLRAATALFGWTGFQSKGARPLLTSCLRSLVERFDTSFSRSSSVLGMVERVVEYIGGFTPNIVAVDVAFQHIRFGIKNQPRLGTGSKVPI